MVVKLDEISQAIGELQGKLEGFERNNQISHNEILSQLKEALHSNRSDHRTLFETTEQNRNDLSRVKGIAAAISFIITTAGVVLGLILR